MPQPSVHNAAKKTYLQHMVWQNVVTPIEDMSLEDSVRQLQLDIKILEEIRNVRYLSGRTNRIPKQGNLHLAFVYAEEPQNHHHFTHMLRVSPYIFEVLVNLIRDNPVFHNNSQNTQMPVDYQLAVTLYRMGRFGNGASLEDIARNAGVAKGTVELYTRRCFDAIESLHDYFLRPLTQEEKEQEKRWVEQEVRLKDSLWREGWVMYDGTIVPLFSKPGLNGDTYFTRKSNYGLNVQVQNCQAQKYGLIPHRSETSHQIYGSLIMFMVSLDRFMTLMHSSTLLPLSIQIGFFLVMNSHLLIQHMLSRKERFLSTKCLHLPGQRTSCSIRWFPTFVFGLSTAWVL
jgi:hypothetical protein